MGLRRVLGLECYGGGESGWMGGWIYGLVARRKRGGRGEEVEDAIVAIGGSLKERRCCQRRIMSVMEFLKTIRDGYLRYSFFYQHACFSPYAQHVDLFRSPELSSAPWMGSLYAAVHGTSLRLLVRSSSYILGASPDLLQRLK